jgi:hypothetical protein
MSAYWLNNTLHVANISSPTTITTVDKDLKFDGDLFFQNHVPNVGDVLTFEGSWKPAVPATGGTSCDTHNLKYLDATGAKGDIVEIVYNDNTVAGVRKTITGGAFSWSNKSGGVNNDYGNDICVDSNGNSYVVGQFQSTALFGGAISRTSNSGNNTFVGKVNSVGTWQWVAQVTNALNTDSNTGDYIACDCSGNSYIFGTATGSSVLSFGPINLTPASPPNSSFLAKINTSGTWQWAIDCPARIDQVVSDCDGNIYVSGTFIGSKTFGPFSITSINPTGDSIFVGKLNTSGTWLWVQQAGDPAAVQPSGQYIAIDCNGNSYIAGGFNGTIYVNQPLTDNGTVTFFMAYIDVNGSWRWGVKLTGTAHTTATNICLDKDNNIYVTGAVRGLGGSTITIPTILGNVIINGPGFGLVSGFTAKFNNLHIWEWANPVVNTGGYSCTVDRNGDVYNVFQLVNDGSGPWTIGPWSFPALVPPIGGGRQEAVIVKMDTNGGWKWYVRTTGTNILNIRKIGIDYEGNMYGTGFFNGNATLGTTTLSSTGVGTYDIVLTRIHHSRLSSLGLLNANTTVGNIVQVSIPGGSVICDAFASTLVPSYNYFVDCNGNFSTCNKCAQRYLGVATNTTTMVTGLN